MLRKKIVICIVALIIALSIFAGCDTEDTTTTTASNTTTTTTTKVSTTTTTTVRPTETTTTPQDETTTTTKTPETTTTTKKPTTTTTTTTVVVPVSENYDIAYRKISSIEYLLGELWRFHECEYNEKGQLIKETSLTPSGKIVYQTEYEYDDEGNLVRESDLDKFGTSETLYDKHGNPLTTTSYDENGEWQYTSQYSYEYEYYSDGTLSHEKQYRVHEDFDGGRRLIGEINYNQDGNPVYSEFHGDFPTVTTHEYDANGREIKEFIDWITLGYTITTEYEYDANGNVSVAIHTIDEYAGFVDRDNFKIVYEYDQYGNLTKETEYDENGEVDHIETYEYEYGEDGVIETETYYFNGELSSVTTYENPFKIYK